MTSLSELTENALYLLLNLTLVGALMVGCVTIAFKLIPTSLPRLRYLILLASFGASVVLPIVFTFGLAAEHKYIASDFATTELTQPDDVTKPATFSNLPVSVPVATQRLNLKTIVRNFLERISGNRLLIVLICVWPLVTLLLAARESLGHFRWLRARRSWTLATTPVRAELGWPNDFPLYIDSQLGPSVIGMFRPSVVLPRRLMEEMTPDQTRQIARHELAHARWRDPLANAVLRVIRVMFWPSIPLWIIERMAHAEREAAADRAAIFETGSIRNGNQVAVDYATSLLSIAQWSNAANNQRTLSPLGTHANDQKVLQDRVNRLLTISTRPCLTRAVFGLIAVTIGAVCIAYIPTATGMSLSAGDGRYRGLPLRFENVADSRVAITEGRIRILGYDNSRVRAAITISNNSDRVIKGFKLSLGSDTPKFYRLITINNVAINPNQSMTIQPEWKQGKLPDWNIDNRGNIRLIAVHYADEKDFEPEIKFSMFIFNGETGPVFIEKTPTGEIEEPIVVKTTAELLKSAVSNIIPERPVDAALNNEGVAVFVFIDEYGNVISARGEAGNKDPILIRAALTAIKQWKFSPSTIDGVPVKTVGTIIFFGDIKTTNGFVTLW